MSIFSFEKLEIYTGFRDIQYIFTESCRRAINLHPSFNNPIEDENLSKMTDYKFQELYKGGNVAATFDAIDIDCGIKICGNIELAGAWNSKVDPFFYINVFEIVENYPFKIQQISRYEVKVEKESSEHNTSSKIHVKSVKFQKPEKKGYGNTLFFSAAVCLCGLFYYKDDIMNHDAFYEFKFSAESAISKFVESQPFSRFFN